MAATENRLEDFYHYLETKKEKMIGYPANQDFDYSFLYEFFKFSINNIGDPLSDGPYQIKAHEFEKEVIEYIAQLTGVSGNNFWGYITNGGTEGNMYGLYVARELYPESIVYFSKDAHYSIPKILKLLKMPYIAIKSNDKGEMCLGDLKQTLLINRTKTPIILATLGTTMKGALDPLDEIKELISDMSFLNHYIHVDAALSGMILPFLENAPKFGLSHGIHSFSISGHKMFGSPMPCGIVLARKDYVDRIGQSIEYIGAIDTTLSGSRNGHSTLFLWYSIQKYRNGGYKRIMASCIENAQYAVEKLKTLGINAWRNPFSITVLFDRPNPSLVSRWQLACQGEISHLITMPHVTKEQIDEFIEDYHRELVCSTWDGKVLLT